MCGRSLLGTRFWCGLGQSLGSPEVSELATEGARKPRPLGDISSAADAKEAQRNSSRMGNLINNLTQLLPGPSEEKQQPLKGQCPKLQKDKNIEEQVGGTPITDTHTHPRTPPRAVPGEPSAPRSQRAPTAVPHQEWGRRFGCGANNAHTGVCTSKEQPCHSLPLPCPQPHAETGTLQTAPVSHGLEGSRHRTWSTTAMVVARERGAAWAPSSPCHQRQEQLWELGPQAAAPLVPPPAESSYGPAVQLSLLLWRRCPSQVRSWQVPVLWHLHMLKHHPPRAQPSSPTAPEPLHTLPEQPGQPWVQLHRNRSWQ